MARDTIITRRQPDKPRLRLARNEGIERSPITSFSRQSRTRAKRHLRNSTCYRSFGVLTFPEEVTDDRKVKSAIERLARKLVRLGISFFWKQEFYKSGRPHLHVLLTKRLPEESLSTIWSACLGHHHVHVYCQPIRDYDRTVTYLMKPCDDAQHRIPEGYRNMGRFWGVRGPKAKPDTFFSLQGSPSDLARLIRPLRKIESRSRLNKGIPVKRDNGVAGRTFYDCGGEAVARAMSNLYGSLADTSGKCGRVPESSGPGLAGSPSALLLLAGQSVLSRESLGTARDFKMRLGA